MLAPRLGLLFAAAFLLGLLALVVPRGMPALALLSVAATLGVLGLAIGLLSARARRVEALLRDRIAQFIDNDASPSFTTDADGEIGHQNRAALERFGSRGGQTLTRALGEIFASPSAVLARLQARAEAAGAAREDMVTRRGHVRLAVHKVSGGAFLWRLEDLSERPVGGRGAESSGLPMMTASRAGTILFMNESFRRVVGERVKSMDRVFRDLPLRSGEVHEVSTLKGPVRATVHVVDGAGGRTEVYLLPAPARGESATDDPAAFEMLPVALMRINADGRVREINRAARGLIGPVETGTPLAELLEGLGRPVGDWLADALAGRSDGRPEVLRARRTESESFFQVTLKRTSDGTGPGLLAVISDATQLKTLEAQFVQSQKMQAIGQLAGGVAHDFNNLLTAITGHCDLLLLRHDRGDPDYADLVQINQNANRAASLVGQLLAFSRKQTMTPRVIDLRDTLSDLTHLLNRLVGEKVRLTLSHDPTLRPIRADRRQIEQVIMNLVVNARDAMPQGGTIKITTENLRLSEALMRDRAAISPGDYVVVRVTDEGTGIPPDKISKLFEPFFTTKRTGEGTGLGLSTAYGIVKQTGGFIFCDSVVGSGTTFTLIFPANDHSEVAEPEPAPQMALRPLREGAGVVLLVEDEAPVRAFASRALRLRGYTVIEAGSAEEALQALSDQALNVDVFVTDVIMPGMDGPSWVREALKNRPGTRVVFVSGYAEESFASGRSEIPNSVFLPKPFSLSELTSTVQNQLH